MADKTAALVPMRVLTLTQPWASMVAVGVKTVETRSWSTHYRGLLAIHAAKGFPTRAKAFAATCRFINDPAMTERLTKLHGPEIPLGAVLAVTTVRGCEAAGGWRDAEERYGEANAALGDFSAGRYAWLLGDVIPLEKPIPVRGALGLWKPDAALYRAVITQAEGPA